MKSAFLLHKFEITKINYKPKNKRRDAYDEIKTVLLNTFPNLGDNNKTLAFAISKKLCPAFYINQFINYQCSWGGAKNRRNKIMGNASEQMIANEQERFKERLARHIGLSNDEFGTLSYKLNTEESEDGMPYNHVLTFERNKNTSRILSKIKSLNHNDQIIIDASTYENL